MSRKIDVTTLPSLLLRLRDHSDARAWSEFVEVYSPMIYDFCRNRDLQSSDAADVTQEVFLRVAKAIRGFEYDRSKGLFRDWLARIVLNEIRRLAKKTLPLLASSQDIDRDVESFESDWNEQFQQHVFASAIERSKGHFSAETWRMFDMSWLRQLPAAEVALRLGVTIDQVYVARSRVLNRLRQEVAILAEEII